MRECLTDLRYAARRAAAAPISALVIVIAVALGVGATTAIVSVMESLFMKPLPFVDPERLVRLGTSMARLGTAPEVNALDARDWTAAPAVQDVGLYDVEDVTLRLDGVEAPVSASALIGDATLARVLGIRPALGRAFTAEDFAPGAPPAVVLGQRFWREAFGADPAAVGRTVGLGTGRAVVVGVWPDVADRFPAGGADLWVPLTYPADSFLNQRGSIALSAIARLRPGVTIDGATAQISTIARRLAVAYPDTNTGRTPIVEPLQAAMVGPVQPIVVLIAFSIAVVLLIACANVANILLAQTWERGRELAMRTALGATRGRLVRQLTSESVGLFAVAGALGVAGAPGITAMILRHYPEALPLAADVRLDGRVLVTAMAVTLAAALLATLPRLRALGRRSVAADLNDSARGLGTPSQRRMARLLIVAQIALSITLLAGAGALLRTVLRLSSVSTGFDATRVVTMRLTLPISATDTPERTLAFEDAARDLAASLSGVEAAAHAMFLPFAAGRWRDAYERIGTADVRPNLPMADFFMVSPEYLSTMGISIRQGRDLSARDAGNAPPVLIVSEAFAARAFPNEPAIGRRLRWDNRSWEIVGIAGDTRHGSLWDAPDPDVYVPRAQNIRQNTWIAVRTLRPAAAIGAELRAGLRPLDPSAVVTDVRRLSDRVSDSLSPERFRALLTASLGALALMLASVGVYGVVSYTVSRRTRDIGIRMALGQSRGSVLGQVLTATWATTAAGAAVGVSLTLALGRVSESWLPGLNVREPGTVLAVVTLFFVVATLAALGPAHRASRVDVIDALR